ncbi:hypothetical protein P6166_04325 [Stenotrophomonas sp. HITSZ_GD]|uniref:hypothetical protein n=1 Tax=Stenotrophomonas sp. HITSZ_GD TaxID=3037248 RepID=UPI00240D52B5|nr:hypothetical protein [Stenotrophomonas sp. HITSZ_GD]MDG2524583.1 hypothetical protein [Stenotrophomonas sp. HITSZ_GD]
MQIRSAFRVRSLLPICAAIGVLAGCQRQAPEALASAATPAEAKAFSWPASLKPIGDGFPRSGDACRRLGESPAVSAYLDHTSVLVGCPGPADAAPAAALLSGGQGKLISSIDGVTVIALPPNAAL